MDAEEVTDSATVLRRQIAIGLFVDSFISVKVKVKNDKLTK